MSPADRAVEMAVGSAPVSVLHTAGCDVASAGCTGDTKGVALLVYLTRSNADGGKHKARPPYW